MKKIDIFGIKIDNVSLDQTMELLQEKLQGQELFTIATPNTEIAMEAKENPDFARLINSFDLVVADGIGLIKASQMKKIPLKERVTGFDISMELLKLGATRPLKLFILASKEGRSQRAADNIHKTYAGVQVVGNRNGYFSLDEEDQIIDQINASQAEVIFVGLGFPKQEEFIARNRKRLKGKIIIGNGGVTDILAGVSKRAPDIFIKLHLEWFYRLLKEPTRFKRQLALPKFIIEVLVNKDSVKEA
ncbi:MAG: WecB/TagA/CpsF family glycosyltransferase [Bacillota bacterium]|nr:WecB/TagA/CpsF family glycosyltransferase [Bacillota bacterium]